MKHTQLGYAAPAIAAPVATGSAADPRGPREALHATMVGVAMPGIAPAQAAQVAAPAPSAPSPRSPSSPRSPRPVAGPRSPRRPPAPELPAPSPRPAVEVDDDLPAGVPGARARGAGRSRTPALIALGAGAVLAASAAAFAFFWRGAPPLDASVRSDAAGRELLHVRCPSCPDGTTLTIGAASAIVTKGEADLALPAPLAVGDNRVEIAVNRPGVGRDEHVDLVVPVAWRVRPDVASLAGGADRTALRIALEVAPGATATVEGKPVALGADGKGSWEVDVTKDATGPADDVRTVERAVAFTVTPPGGAAQAGTLPLRIPIAPLIVEAPGERGVVETAAIEVAGRTLRGASVTLDGAPIAVAPDGSFAHTLALPAPGASSHVLRATASDHAARSVTVQVERVASLAAFAKDFAARAPLAWGELAADPARHVGEPVALDGAVLEARSQGRQTILLLDVTRGCARAPCTARVLTGADVRVLRGGRVRAFGVVRRAFTPDGASAPMPEIAADFLLHER